MYLPDHKHTYLNGFVGYFCSKMPKHTCLNCFVGYFGFAWSGGSGWEEAPPDLAKPK